MFKRLLSLAFLLLSGLAWGQYTNLTATIKDSKGQPYANCTYSVAFVGQSTSPGPYLLGGQSVFQTTYNGQACNSLGVLAIRLPDNNQISPTPSQWNFSICSASGYVAGPYCFTALVTVTGATQDASTTISAAAPTLVIGGTGTGSGGAVQGTTNQIVATTPPNSTTTTLSLPSPVVFPGGGLFQDGLSNSSPPVLLLTPLSTCLYYGNPVVNPDQISDYNGNLVFNHLGGGGPCDLVPIMAFTDLINNPPRSGSTINWNPYLSKLDFAQPPANPPTGVPLYPRSVPGTFNGMIQYAPPGIGTNAQTGTTYTIAATDRGGYLTLSNAGAIAVTLPQAGTTGFDQNFYINKVCDIGVGTTTITPTTSTISYTTGGTYTSGAASLALSTGQCAWIGTNNTNYFAVVWNASGIVGNCTVATGIAFYGTTGTTITCPTGLTPSVTYSPSTGQLFSNQGNLTGGSNAWLSHVATFNSGTNTFQGYLDNIVCTAAATATKLFQLQVSSVDVVSLTFNGTNCTNGQWLIPAGSVTLPGLIFGANTGGLYSRANNVFGFTNGTSEFIEFAQSGPKLQSGGGYGITNNANAAAGTVDTGWHRAAAGVLEFDTDSSLSNGLAFLASAIGGGYGARLVATAALVAGQPVKMDTANANQVVVTVTTDTGAGIVVGVVQNSPGAAGTANVMQIGTIAMTLGTGTCAIGNFVIVDTTTNGRVKCTATYSAGTVIGVAMAAQATVGSTFNVMLGLR